jgi:hypothetical protein
VDLYNIVTRAWSTAQLSQARTNLAATALQLRVYFGGGTDQVDILDTSTGVWSTAQLSQARDRLAAVSVGNLVMFGGGRYATHCNCKLTSCVLTNDLTSLSTGGRLSGVLDIYNSNTGVWSASTLVYPRFFLAAAGTSTTILFDGGESPGRR